MSASLLNALLSRKSVALNSSISPKARVDLDAIWSFIAADSERAADAVLEQFTAAFVMLTENPNAGRPRPELSASIRSFPIGSYLIFYAAESRGGIKIFRVMPGRQDLTRQDFSA